VVFNEKFVSFGETVQYRGKSVWSCKIWCVGSHDWIHNSIFSKYPPYGTK